MRPRDRWMVARRGKWLAARKNERERERERGRREKERKKEKEAAAGEKRASWYIQRRKGSGGWSSACTPRICTPTRQVHIDGTYVHIHSHRLRGGSRVCTRTRAHRTWVGSTIRARTRPAGSRLMLHNIGRHHWNKPGGINLNVFWAAHGPGAFVSQEALSTISPNRAAATVAAAFLNPRVAFCSAATRHGTHGS